MRLTATAVKGLREPGSYGDGDGLWLRVKSADRRSWMLRYMRLGRARSMALGSVEDVSLAQAREKAAAARKQLRDGIDPLDQRDAERTEQVVAASKAKSFADAVERYIAAHEAAWKNAKHAQQWRNTLTTYAGAEIGRLPVDAIDTEHVLRVLEPIWRTKPETAARVRGRLEMVLSYATARGWRDGPNPCVWRGHLQLMLPAHGKVRKVKHHAALDWRAAPAFLAGLRERDSFGARGLEFAILTAARSGEVRGATWDEIDLTAATWTVAAERMKGRRTHRVPLASAALAILRDMARLKDGSGLIFLGQKRGLPMSDMTLTAVLRRMGRGELTAHGFRSTFRDWAAESTHYPTHVVEQALAHQIGDKVEAAYRRGDLFEKRVALMADWATYLVANQAGEKVVPIRASA